MTNIYFKLSSNEDQYQEFSVGLDTFRFVFNYNSYNRRYYLTVYKNFNLILKSVKLVITPYNLFAPYKYKNIGSLSILLENYTLDGDKKIYNEITKSNITEAVFRWKYGD